MTESHSYTHDPPAVLPSSAVTELYTAASYPPPTDDGFGKQFWKQRLTEIQQSSQDYKSHQLPLARIKKVMKTDEDVKMISAEAPILFSKGCDIFITELTLRAWKHAVDNKRRTLQRSDVAAAISKSDMLDFLIDIVPPEEYSQGLAKDTNYQRMSQAYGGMNYEFAASQYAMNDHAVMNALHQHQPHLALQQQQRSSQPHPFMQHPPQQ